MVPIVILVVASASPVEKYGGLMVLSTCGLVARATEQQLFRRGSLATGSGMTRKEAEERKAAKQKEGKKRRKNTNKIVTTATVLNLYQQAARQGDPFDTFLHRLTRIGGYKSKKEAYTRFRRAEVLVRKKYGLEMVRLHRSPRLPTDTTSLLEAYGEALRAPASF